MNGPKIYSFDDAWLSPVYESHFVILCLALAALIVVVVGICYRRMLPRGQQRPAQALAFAAGALILIELVLSGLTWILPPQAYLKSWGQFWKLKPQLAGEIDQQKLSADSWVVRDTYALQRLRPSMTPHVVPEWVVRTVVFSNSSGLREREIPFDKAAGEYRVLCIGSSWTFGLGVRAEETFSRRLEEDLRKLNPGRTITVINAGTNGGKYTQGYLMLTQLGLRYHPDLVLSCGYQLSDELPALEAVAPANPAVALARHSTLYRVLRFATMLGRGSDSACTLTRADYALKMARVLADHGIPGIFFEHATPLAHRAPGRSEIGKPPPFLRGVTQVPGMAAIDLRPRTYHPGGAGFMLRAEPGHPGPYGHAEIGRVLAEYIQAHHYLDHPVSTP